MTIEVLIGIGIKAERDKQELDRGNE